MRKRFSRKVESGRIRRGEFATETGDRFGAFDLEFRGVELLAIVSAGDEEVHWEHVSVSVRGRCPTWDEMCFAKECFWNDEETVLQFHPRRSEYINNHEHVLHLWKLRGVDHKLPPTKCV